MLSDDELWSTGLGTSDSVEAAGETGCGLNAHDGALTAMMGMTAYTLYVGSYHHDIVLSCVYPNAEQVFLRLKKKI